MQRFFSILTDAVERFEGTVDKFTGDGIMAVFGAPIAHEDHAAARLLRGPADARRRRRVRGRAAPRRGPQLLGPDRDQLGRGRRRGDRRRRLVSADYTAIGHTVGLAQRMEALAEPGKAYLTESTAELAQRLPRARGPRRVRDQGREPAGAGLRAGRRRRGPLAARPLARARLLPLRRPRRRRWRSWRRPSSGPSEGEGDGRRRRRRARRRQEPPLPRIRRTPPRERDRGLRGAGPVARQVDPLHAGAADDARLLRDRRRRPRPDRPREDRRPGAAPRSRVRRRACPCSSTSSGFPIPTARCRR